MNTRNLATTVVALLGFLFVGTAHADYIPNAITGATATGTHTADAGSSSLLADYDDGDGHIYDIRTNPALAAVSGYGLTVTDGNGTHSSKWEEDWQSNITQTNPTTPDGTLVASQQFYVDLGASYDNLDELYVWNVREQTARGTKDVDLYYSDLADPGADLSVTANWTLLDSYVFSQSTGGGTGVDNVIDLSSVSSARHFGFDISSNYGDTGRVGLAEVQFTVVPEPSTVSMLLAALGTCLLPWFPWRKR